MAASRLGRVISRSTSLLWFFFVFELVIILDWVQFVCWPFNYTFSFSYIIFAARTKLSLLLINSIIRPNNHFWRGCLSSNMLTISPLVVYSWICDKLFETHEVMGYANVLVSEFAPNHRQIKHLKVVSLKINSICDNTVCKSDTWLIKRSQNPPYQGASAILNFHWISYKLLCIICNKRTSVIWLDDLRAIPSRNEFSKTIDERLRRCIWN